MSYRAQLKSRQTHCAKRVAVWCALEIHSACTQRIHLGCCRDYLKKRFGLRWRLGVGSQAASLRGAADILVRLTVINFAMARRKGTHATSTFRGTSLPGGRGSCAESAVQSAPPAWHWGASRAQLQASIKVKRFLSAQCFIVFILSLSTGYRYLHRQSSAIQLSSR